MTTEEMSANGDGAVTGPLPAITADGGAQVTLATAGVAAAVGSAVVRTVPDEFRIALDGVGLVPAVAVCAALTADDVARHFDVFLPGAAEPNVRAIALVRERLRAIDDLVVELPDGARVPFNAGDALHFAALSTPVIRFLYEALLDEADALLFPEANS